MDLRKIRKLIELLEESSLAEMEIESGDERIALRRASAGQWEMTPAVASSVMQAGVPLSAPPPASAEVQAAPEENEEAGSPITSPIVGTFYEAASPSAPPFAKNGQRVSKGDVLCIVEAMKMMNEIKAPHSGTVTVIEARNAYPVEYGQVLMYIKED